MGKNKAGSPVKKDYGRTYTRKELTGYLTGLAGQNIIYNIIGVGLVFYFQSVIFVPAMACAVIFLIARVWDAFNDPMMGSIVDKTRTKWGKCKPYLLFVPAVIMVTTILPFLNKMYAEPKEEISRLVAMDGYTYNEKDLENEIESFVYKDSGRDNKEYTVKVLRLPDVQSILVMKVDKETGETVFVDDGTQKSIREDFLKDGTAAVKDLDKASLEAMPAVQKYTKKEVPDLEKEELARYTKDDTEYVLYQVTVDNRVGLVYDLEGNGELQTYENFEQSAVLEEYKAENGFTVKSGFSGILIILWAAFSYILWGMTYTIGDIPLWGVTSLMTEDQKDRAKALALARICASFGAIGMAFTYIAPAFQDIFRDQGASEAKSLQYAYMLTAVILTVFASVLFQFAGLSVHERVEPSNEKPHTMKENFQTMWRCQPFRKLLISGVLRSPIQLLSTVAITLVMYYFFNNDLMGTMFKDGQLNTTLLIWVIMLFIGIMGGMLVSSGMSPGIAEKVGKKRLYNIYSFLGAVPFVLVFLIYLISGGNLLTWTWVIVISIVFFVASWAQGGLNVLQSVMIADCVDYEEYTNGVRPDGVFFAGQSFITKLGAGIAALIQFVAFAIVGFSGGRLAVLNSALSYGQNFHEYQGGKFALTMFLLVSIPPAIGMVLSGIPTLKYSLTDEEHTRILDELNAKRNAGEIE